MGYAAIPCDGALVKGKPAVEGCRGAGIPLNASRCARARDPTLTSSDPMTTAALRTADTSSTAATPTMTSVWGDPGEITSAMTTTVAAMTSRSYRVRIVAPV